MKMMSISQMLKLIYDFWNLWRCFYKDLQRIGQKIYEDQQY